MMTPGKFNHNGAAPLPFHTAGERNEDVKNRVTTLVSAAIEEDEDEDEDADGLQEPAVANKNGQSANDDNETTVATATSTPTCTNNTAVRSRTNSITKTPLGTKKPFEPIHEEPLDIYQNSFSVSPPLSPTGTGVPKVYGRLTTTTSKARTTGGSMQTVRTGFLLRKADSNNSPKKEPDSSPGLVHLASKPGNPDQHISPVRAGASNAGHGPVSGGYFPNHVNEPVTPPPFDIDTRVDGEYASTTPVSPESPKSPSSKLKKRFRPFSLHGLSGLHQRTPSDASLKNTDKSKSKKSKNKKKAENDVKDVEADGHYKLKDSVARQKMQDLDAGVAAVAAANQRKSAVSAATSTSTPNKVGQESDEIEQERTREAARLAAIMMNLKYSQENDDAMHGQSHSHHRHHHHQHHTSQAHGLAGQSIYQAGSSTSGGLIPSPPSKSKLRISTHKSRRSVESPLASPTAGSPTLFVSGATRARAVKARAKLELQYEMIGEFQNPNFRKMAVHHQYEHQYEETAHNATATEFEQQLHQEFYREGQSRGKELREQTTYNPLQILRNRSTKKSQGRGYGQPISGPQNQSLFWSIDVSELVSDFSWRIRYRHLMVDRHGQLLYPEYMPLGEHMKHLLGHTVSRGHIKQSSRELSAGVSSGGNSDGSWTSDGEAVTPLNGLAIRTTPTTTTTKDGIVIATGASGSGGTAASGRKLSITAPPIVYPSSVASSGGAGGDSSRLRPVLSGAPSHGTTATGNSALSTTTTASTDQQLQQHHHSSALYPTLTGPDVVGETLVEQENRLLNYAHQLAYLDLVFRLSYRSVSSRPEQYWQTLRSDSSDDLSKSIGEVARQVTDIRIPKELELVDLNVKRMRDYHKELTVDVATKLDKVLSESDRMINEVNTTFNLEIRKVAGRLDQLEADSPSVKWAWKLGYCILEWTVLLLMWFVWLVFFTVRTATISARALVSTVRWLMWC